MEKKDLEGTDPAVPIKLCSGAHELYSLES